MFRSVKCHVPLLLCVSISLFSLSTSRRQDNGSRQLVEGIGKLSAAILQQIATDGQNSIHSSYGISSALALCLFGAEGESYTSIRSVLNLDRVGDSDIPKIFSDVNEIVRRSMKVNSRQHLGSSSSSGSSSGSGSNLTMSVANGLFANSSLKLRSDYIDEVQNAFQNTQVDSVDFAGNAEKVQFKINSFVNAVTRGKIPSLLDRPIDRQTLLAIINAVYFKGTWKTALKNKSSSDSFNNFTCTAGRTDISTKVDWMMLSSRLNYGRSSELAAHLLELPYQSDDDASVSMMLILPFGEFKCSVTNWIKRYFDWRKVNDAMRQMYHTRIDLTLPKFKLESTYDLRNTLSILGLDSVFSTSASFDRMFSSSELSTPIATFVHKAKMSVDELGTEAAAASGVFLRRRSRPLPSTPPIELVFNRSFLAMILLKDQAGFPFPLFTALVNQI